MSTSLQKNQQDIIKPYIHRLGLAIADNDNLAVSRILSKKIDDFPIKEYAHRLAAVALAGVDPNVLETSSSVVYQSTSVAKAIIEYDLFLSEILEFFIRHEASDALETFFSITSHHIHDKVRFANVAAEKLDKLYLSFADDGETIQEKLRLASILFHEINKLKLNSTWREKLIDNYFNNTFKVFMKLCTRVVI